MRNETKREEQAKGIHWHTAIFVGLFHLGAVAALFMFNWRALVVAIALWWISASLGVGIGFHRQFNWWGIRVMQLLGLAKAIKLVSAAQRTTA